MKRYIFVHSINTKKIASIENYEKAPIELIKHLISDITNGHIAPSTDAIEHLLKSAQIRTSKYIVFTSVGVIYIEEIRDRWHIEEIEELKIMTTNRQQAAVHFCEQWLHLTFDGDINDFKQVSRFLSKHLQEAKNLCEEVSCEYRAYLWNLD